MEKSELSLQSMTGFGRGVAEQNDFLCICEIRSVNHRGLDVKIRLPKELFSCESEYIKKVQRLFSRGRVDINMTLSHQLTQLRKIKFDLQAASSLVDELLSFREFKPSLDPNIRVGDLLSIHELFAIEDLNDLTETIKPLAQKAIELALLDLSLAREAEGKNLFLPISESLSSCKKMVTELKSHVQDTPKQHYTHLLERIKKLLTEQGIDDTRLAQEAAFLADKSDVTEEIDRLLAHFDHFFSLCGTKSTGRKLDFLCQEMFREANTIGDKCGNVFASHLVVEIKAEIERLREQVQNVE